MTKADYYIYELLKKIKENGWMDENPRPKLSDGSPAYTVSINGQFREYDIGAGEYPICTLRKIAWKSAIKEIFWIYQKQSNDLNVLRNEFGVKYWDLWESEDLPGTIGVRYGEIVRRYKLVENLLDGLINDPFGRRHIIDLYQYKDMAESDGLNPCAFLTIWNVRKDKEGNMYLDLSLIQRSGDSMAASCSGVNECQYAAFLMMVAKHCNYRVGKLYHYVANEQIYEVHMDAVDELIKRYEEKKAFEEHGVRHQVPRLILDTEKTNFYDFTIDDFKMIGYEPITPQLKLELGV